MGKYLKFHEKCMKTGKIPNYGLCNCFPNNRKLELLSPDSDERYDLLYSGFPMVYWGRDNYNQSIDDYSKLRQTIVLFMAAMNGEL